MCTCDLSLTYDGFNDVSTVLELPKCTQRAHGARSEEGRNSAIRGCCLSFHVYLSGMRYSQALLVLSHNIACLLRVFGTACVPLKSIWYCEDFHSRL